MSWGETWRLMGVLVNDPSSHVGAALAGWTHPVTREWVVAADAYDAFVAANTDPKRGSKPKPYPRPWDKKPQAFGVGTSMTVAEWRQMRADLGGGGRRRDARGRFVAAD